MATKFCPRDPRWAIKMLERIGPRGKLKEYLECENVQKALIEKGYDLKKDFGVEPLPGVELETKKVKVESKEAKEAEGTKE